MTESKQPRQSRTDSTAGKSYFSSLFARAKAFVDGDDSKPSEPVYVPTLVERRRPFDELDFSKLVVAPAKVLTRELSSTTDRVPAVSAIHPPAAGRKLAWRHVFWLMNSLCQTITKGGYLTPAVFVPQAVWAQQSVAVSAFSVKVKVLQRFRLVNADVRAHSQRYGSGSSEDRDKLASLMQQFAAVLKPLQTELSFVLECVPEVRVRRPLRRTLSSGSSSGGGGAEGVGADSAPVVASPRVLPDGSRVAPLRTLESSASAVSASTGASGSAATDSAASTDASATAASPSSRAATPLKRLGESTTSTRGGAGASDSAASNGGLPAATTPTSASSAGTPAAGAGAAAAKPLGLGSASSEVKSPVDSASVAAATAPRLQSPSAAAAGSAAPAAQSTSERLWQQLSAKSYELARNASRLKEKNLPTKLTPDQVTAYGSMLATVLSEAQWLSEFVAAHRHSAALLPHIVDVVCFLQEALCAFVLDDLASLLVSFNATSVAVLCYP